MINDPDSMFVKCLFLIPSVFYCPFKLHVKLWVPTTLIGAICLPLYWFSLTLVTKIYHHIPVQRLWLTAPSPPFLLLLVLLFLFFIIIIASVDATSHSRM